VARLTADRDDPAVLAAGLLAEEDRRRASSDNPVAPTTHVLPPIDEVSLADALAVGGRRAIALLFLLNVVDEFDRAALAVLGPDIQKTFGISDATLGFLNGIGGVAVFAAAVPFGLLADRRTRVPLVAAATLVWSVFALLGGLATSALMLGTTRVFNGLGKGVTPVHSSLLADAYPTGARGRIFAIHAAANPVGNALGPFLAGGVAAIAGGVAGWRWALGILAVPAVALAFATFVLPEPERGRFDREDDDSADETVSPVSLAAGLERLRQIHSFSALMAALGVLGLAIAGAPTVFNLFLEQRHGLDAFDRGVAGSVIALGSAVGALVGGPLVDRLYRRSPSSVMTLSGASLGVFGIVYPAALYVPNLALLVLAHAVAFAFVTAPLVSINTVVAAVVPPRLRGLGFAFVGLYLFLVGGLMGGTVLGWLSDAWGERTALAVAVPICCAVGGLIIARGGRTIAADMAAVAEEATEDREERRRRRTSGTGAILQVRNLDFSYGSVQVLFDVNLDVNEGEVVALLGTNGAGKSTVLRAVSGLCVPSRGVIRFDGETVTFADPATRVRRGIVQVPGGKAIFPTLSVMENLQAGAYTYIWDRDRLRARIEDAVALFPKLAERLDQPAGTMSGGEQQMLAIAKALLLDPRVLLIDELSLGLAPVVVQELLQVVEGLAAQGMTIVVVEQSVNVALAMASRAIFMEKGQVRFEGAAQELLDRDDLLRAVFLGGEQG
jgi:ABC-type branched-subunit amino acid transport system ATPase component/sugar phosphate permease